MKNNIKKIIFLIVLVLIVFFIIFIYKNDLLQNINFLKSSINNNDDYVDIRVGTFNIGSWKCGNGFQGATCENATNDKISQLLNSQNLDIIGFQEAATFDDNNNTLSNNIIELANMTNFNVRYVAPKQINAIFSKFSLSNLNDEYNIPIIDCTYTSNNYMEKRALVKEIIEVNGVKISVYVTHIGHSNCNDIHFADIARILSQDCNPIILMGDFNRISDDRFREYLLPLGFEVAAHDYNFTNNQAESFADSIFVKSNDMIQLMSEEEIDTYDSYSDHNLIIATLRVMSNKEASINNCPNISSLPKKDNNVILNYKNTKKTITDLIGTTDNIKVLRNDVEISNDEKLATGDILKINEIEYQIVILGDTTKDGIIDLMDIYGVYRYYKYTINNNKGREIKEQVVKEAADFNQDTHIDLNDVYKIYREYKKEF